MATLTIEAARDIESSHHYNAHPMRSVTEAARDRKVCALIMTGRGVQEVAEAFSISTRKVTEILTEYQYDPAVQSIHHNLAAFARSQRTAVKTTATKPTPKKTAPTGAVKVNNDDIFSALREAMEATQAGADLSQLEYDAWRAANKPDAPGTRTIRRRLGWQQAKELASSVRSIGGYSAVVEALPVRVYQPEPLPVSTFEKVEENKSENVVDIYR